MNFLEKLGDKAKLIIDKASKKTTNKQALLVPEQIFDKVKEVGAEATKEVTPLSKYICFFFYDPSQALFPADEIKASILEEEFIKFEEQEKLQLIEQLTTLDVPFNNATNIKSNINAVEQEHSSAVLLSLASLDDSVVNYGLHPFPDKLVISYIFDNQIIFSTTIDGFKLSNNVKDGGEAPLSLIVLNFVKAEIKEGKIELTPCFLKDSNVDVLVESKRSFITYITPVTSFKQFRRTFN